MAESSRQLGVEPDDANRARGQARSFGAAPPRRKVAGLTSRLLKAALAGHPLINRSEFRGKLPRSRVLRLGYHRIGTALATKMRSPGYWAP